MTENKSGKRIIAIAVSPKAYDEISNLKGDRTWTKWLLFLMLLENPTNEVLNNELLGFTKLKLEAEPKPKKAKVEAKAVAEPEGTLPGGVPVDLSKIGKHKKVEVGV